MDEKIVINIGGMHCVNCAKSVEGALLKIKGVRQATVAFASEKAVAFVDTGKVGADEIKRAVESAGFTFLGIDGQIGQEQLDSKKSGVLRSYRLKWIVGFAIGGMLMALGMGALPMAPHRLMLVQFLSSTPVFLYISYPIFRAAWSAIRTANLTMDVMYALGMGVAYAASVCAAAGLLFSSDFMFFDTAVLLAAFLTLGRYLELRARTRTSSAIRALMDLRPKRARVIVNGQPREVSIESVVVGDILQVLPGDAIPVDGEIASGESWVDESMITGEAAAKAKKKGSPIIAGTINKSGMVTMVARKVGNETVLARIIQLVTEAQNSKPPIQKIADRAVSWFIPVVLAVAILSGMLWLYVFGSSLPQALSVCVSVLVVACPCALGLATPTALSVGLGKAAQLGILIKNGEILELLEKISVVAFDKTGTLTKGALEVTDIVAANHDATRVLILAASIEQNSRHPIAAAIVAHARGRGCAFKSCGEFAAEEGKGVTGVVDNNEIIVGAPSLLEQRGVPVAADMEQRALALSAEAKSVSYVACGGVVAGIIACADTLKETSRAAVNALRAMGMRTVILSGDNEHTAAAVGRAAGVDTAYGGILPAEKAGRIKELQRQGARVAFVGDGINDAVALAQADIGIALGAGTDVAVESAGMVLMRDDCLDVAAALQLGKAVMRRIRLNLFWAFAYNGALIPCAAGLLYPVFHVMVRPEWAGLAMAMSSVTVVTLSLGLRRFTPSV